MPPSFATTKVELMIDERQMVGRRVPADGVYVAPNFSLICPSGSRASSFFSISPCASSNNGPATFLYLGGRDVVGRRLLGLPYV
jgi:hypothetical protein